MGGGNAKGIFALIDYDWLNQDTLDTPVKWHCGDPEGDPWEWRMRALVEMQMGLFITMTGRKQKKNKYGIEYGWNSTVFTTVENFWAERDYEIPELDAAESYEKIRQQILLLNPMAEEKNIHKFIKG